MSFVIKDINGSKNKDSISQSPKKYTQPKQPREHYINEVVYTVDHQPSFSSKINHLSSPIFLESWIKYYFASNQASNLLKKFTIMAFLFINKPSGCYLATLSVLLILSMAVSISTSAPAADGSATSNSDEEVQDLIEQVLGGIEVMIQLGSHLNGSILDIQDFQSVSEI